MTTQATRINRNDADGVAAPSNMRIRQALVLLLWVGLAVVFLIGLGRSAAVLAQLSRVAVITVEGELHELRRDDVAALLVGQAKGNFFSVDLAAVRRAAMTSPWVEDAVVQRRWPGTLIVAITEKRPVARWGQGALISSRGEVFSPVTAKDVSGLPVLFGPVDKAVHVMEQYRAMNGILRAIGSHVTELQLSERRAWFLTLDNGIRVVVDNDDPVRKLQRFVYLYERQLMPDADSIASIDLRYRNGISVAWKADRFQKNLSAGV